MATEKTKKQTAEKKPVVKKPVAEKKAPEEKKEVVEEQAVASEEKKEATKKQKVFYRNIKDKNVIAELVKKPNKTTAILKAGNKSVTVSIGTLEKLWEVYEPNDEEKGAIEAKSSEEKKAERKKAVSATVAEWASVEALTSAVKKLVVDMTYKTKHSDRDLLCYSGKNNIISFYIAKDRVRVLFKESEAVRNELKNFEIVKGTAQPSVILNYASHTQDDLQHVVDTIIKIVTADKEKPAKANKEKKSEKKEEEAKQNED